MFTITNDSFHCPIRGVLTWKWTVTKGGIRSFLSDPQILTMMLASKYWQDFPKSRFHCRILGGWGVPKTNEEFLLLKEVHSFRILFSSVKLCFPWALRWAFSSLRSYEYKAIVQKLASLWQWRWWQIRRNVKRASLPQSRKDAFISFV